LNFNYVLNDHCKTIEVLDNEKWHGSRTPVSFKDFNIKPPNNCYLYGVADNAEQVMKHYSALANNKQFWLVTITPIRKDEQPEKDGWRWHKWGPYIGNETPMHEYLFDEPHIDEVVVFQLLEVE